MLEKDVNTKEMLANEITLPSPGFPTSVAILSEKIHMMSHRKTEIDTLVQKATFALSFNSLSELNFFWINNAKFGRTQ